METIKQFLAVYAAQLSGVVPTHCQLLKLPQTNAAQQNLPS